MGAVNETWTVLPHGPLTEIDEGVWSVVGQIHMPMVEHFPRRMTVVRLKDGGLVVWSAIALNEAEMTKLEAAGRPEFLVVPNAEHRQDAKAWKTRYPQMRVVTPTGSREKVADAVPVDTTAPDFGDPDVQFLVVPGTRDVEAALRVQRPTGTTLVLNDLVGNIQHESGFSGWLLRLMGFAGDHAQIPQLIKLRLVKDTEELRAQLLAWAEDATLRRIVVSHGDVIEAEPRKVLGSLAAGLK